jgi:hypothetical protein
MGLHSSRCALPCLVLEHDLWNTTHSHPRHRVYGKIVASAFEQPRDQPVDKQANMHPGAKARMKIDASVSIQHVWFTRNVGASSQGQPLDTPGSPPLIA